jgi:hypothetical protein
MNIVYSYLSLKFNNNNKIEFRELEKNLLVL